jgi:hypothetical protein
MSINLSIFPTEAPAVIWLEDGSSVTADPQQEQSFQLPSGSFCTISSTAGSEESDEHPPINGEAFAEAMIDFWRSMIDKIRAEAAGAPTATPL